MKRIHVSDRMTERFIKAGLIAALAAILLLPASIGVNGAEFAPRTEVRPVTANAPALGSLPVQPIPHLDSIPWLSLERGPKGLKIDTLLPPPPPSLEPAIAGAGNGQPPWLSSSAAANGLPNG